MRKLTQLMLTLALLVVGVGEVKAAKVFELDYSQKTGFPFYVMGYVPEWVGGVMTDYGAAYKYQLKSEADGGGVDVSEAVIVATDNGTQYYRWTTGGGWHQYKIAEGVPTVVDGTYTGIYTVKALVKASETCSFNVDMRWGWNDGESKSANIMIPQSDEFVEVEWSYSGISGTSCDLIAQPGGTTATIEWKSLAVYSYDGSKNHVLRVTNSSAKTDFWGNTATYTFAEPLTKGTKYTVTAKICAADVTRGSVMRFVLIGGEGSVYGGDKDILANTFTQVSQEFTANANTDLEIDLGYIKGRVYIDDVSVVAEGSSTNLVSNDDFEETLVTTGWTVPGYTQQVIGHSEKEQGDVALGVRKVTIGSTGWATMIAPDFPLSVADDVDAYYAKYDSEKNHVKLTPIDDMRRYGSAVINGEPGDYYFPRITDGDITSNSTDDGMSISWGSVVGDGTHYALGAKGGVVGFVKVKSGVTIPSGKPYLVITDLPDASRDFFGFGEDEATGIENLTPALSEGEGTVYDLQGRRVAQPTKGLYIVNGKKVLVK